MNHHPLYVVETILKSLYFYVFVVSNVSAKYEKRSTILTTNQPFSKWGEVFGDPVIANAILDRLVHHCEIIKITGLSYRIKGKSIFEEDA